MALIVVNTSALNTAKIQRQTAKATLRRLGEALVVIQENKRPASEISDHPKRPTQANVDNAVLKHEEYANLIIFDMDFHTDFETEEKC